MKMLRNIHPHALCELIIFALVIIATAVSLLTPLINR